MTADFGETRSFLQAQTDAEASRLMDILYHNAPLVSTERSFIMGNFIDLTGMRFGHWTVLGRSKQSRTGENVVFWDCKCDCGYVGSIQGYSLKRGDSRSCGCQGKGYRATHNRSRFTAPCEAQRLPEKTNNQPVASVEARFLDALDDGRIPPTGESSGIREAIGAALCMDREEAIEEILILIAEQTFAPMRLAFAAGFEAAKR